MQNEKIKKAREAIKLTKNQEAVLKLMRKDQKGVFRRHLSEEEKSFLNSLPEEPKAYSARSLHAHVYMKSDRDLARMHEAFKSLDTAAKKKLQEKVDAMIQTYRQDLEKFLSK